MSETDVHAERFLQQFSDMYPKCERFSLWREFHNAPNVPAMCFAHLLNTTTTPTFGKCAKSYRGVSSRWISGGTEHLAKYLTPRGLTSVQRHLFFFTGMN